MGRNRLEPDPVAAPIVRRIFEEYADGRGMTTIARHLASAYDRARNSHRTTEVWETFAIRAVLHR